MNESQIGGWIRSLPRAKASPGFASDVMRAVRAPERRMPFVWRFAAVTMMVVCLAAITQIAIVQQQRRERYESLRLEQQRIQADLQAVKEITEDAEPVVVLENDHGTRVVMDMDSAIQPASLKSYD